MKMTRTLLTLSALLLGAGMFAADFDRGPGRGPEDRGPGRGPEDRGGHGRRGRRPDVAKILQLTEQESAAIKKAAETQKSAGKAIREKALAEAKTSAAAAFDASLKIYKEAAARLTDKDAKAKADKFLARMAEHRERIIEMQANRMLMPERNMMRGPRPDGPRPNGPRPDGDRPEPPPER